MFLLWEKLTASGSLAIAGVAIVAVSIAGWADNPLQYPHYIWQIFRNCFACLIVVVAYRSAGNFPMLAGWQSIAAATTWYLFGGPVQIAAAVLLVASVCLCRARSKAYRTPNSDVAINTFMGVLVAVIAIHGSNVSRTPLALWLLPVIPLIMDSGGAFIMKLFNRPQNHKLLACGQMALAGSVVAQRRVIFVTGFGWCGVIAWWAMITGNHSLVAIIMAASPLAFAVSVLLVGVKGQSKSSGYLELRGPSVNRIRGLDGLRAIAVGLVLLSHAGLMEAPFWQHSGAIMLLNAQVGVQIFFVLSGLLITQLLLAEHSRFGRISFSRFFLRRSLRIFPVYYASIAVSFALAAAAVYPINASAFAAAVFYIMNFAAWDTMEASFSHFWSLAVEEHFYFLWPLAIAASHGRVRFTVAVAVICILFLCWWQLSPPGWVLELRNTHAIDRWTVPAVLPIVVGCLMGALLWQREVRPILSISIGASGALVFVLPALPMVWSLVPEPFRMLVSSVAIAAVIAFLMTSQNSWPVRFLESRVLVYLGTISYGIYVWQGILTGNGSYRPVPGWPPDPISGAFLTLVVAAISYHYFEKPILGWKDRLGFGFSPSSLHVR